MNKNIILFVNKVPPAAVEAVVNYRKIIKEKLVIAVIRDSRIKRDPNAKKSELIDIEILCDFGDSEKIAEAINPYSD